MISFTKACVVGSGRAADPCAAPEEALRSLGGRPAAFACDRAFGVSRHREIIEPCRSEVAEYFAFRIKALGPVVAPQLIGVGLSCIYHFFRHIHPCFQVVVYMNGRSVYPFAGHVVGEYAVCVVYGRGHIISGILHGLCRSLKGVPVRNISLHFVGIVCSENLRRNLTVVDQKSRAPPATIRP